MFAMRKRALLVIPAFLVVGAAWWAFRPERLFIDKTVSEALPEVMGATSAVGSDGSPAPVLSGQFHTNVHHTVGSATIYRVGSEKLVLRLTNFETSNGPDVQIYLVASNDVTDNETVTRAGFINLGPMKGNIGDQNYDVPADVDLTKYRAVTVWCRRFSMNFGTAPLVPAT